ncbi:hypothetical protein BJX64DRAFT_174584 [Aspergillus heterothallicus]
MVERTVSTHDIDPNHISCVGGTTVVTCPSCAGNAPKNSVCTSCRGCGINMFVCRHCNPAAAISRTSAATSESLTPASLSRSSSTSVSSYNDRLAPNSARRLGEQDGSSGGGQLETNSRNPRGS